MCCERGSGVGKNLEKRATGVVDGTGGAVMFEIICWQVQTMTETPSIPPDSESKARLHEPAKRSKRSDALPVKKAITASVETEEWPLGEIRDGMADLDSGQVVSHDEVSKWLKSWGNKDKTKAP